MYRINARFPKVKYHIEPMSENDNLLSGENKDILLDTGDIIIQNRLQKTYQEENAVYWENEQEKGCLWLYHYGLAGCGRIRKAGVEQVVIARSDDAEYNICYKKHGTEIKYVLKIGTRISRTTGGFLMYGALYYDGNKVIESYECGEDGYIKENQSDNGFLKLSFVDNSLHLDIDCSSVWSLGDAVHSFLGDDFNLWSAAVTLKQDYSGILAGQVMEQETSAEGVICSGKKYTVIKSNSMLISDFPTKPLGRPDGNRLELQRGLRKMGNAPLSITQLYTFPAPDMAAANKLAVEILYYLAVYYVADKTYVLGGNRYAWNSWFGIAKAAARDKIIHVDKRILGLVEGEKAVKSIQDFLVDYAEANLSYAYIDSENADILQAFNSVQKKLDKEAPYCSLRELCNFYMEGDGESSLAENPGYLLAMEEINKYTYAHLTRGLDAYMEDTSGHWGEKLYQQCLGNLQQLRLTSFTGSEGSTEVSHKCMLLNILDTDFHDISGCETEKGESVKMTWGSALYAQLFNLQIADMANNLGVEYISPEKLSPEEQVKYRHEILEKVFGCIWDELQKDVSDYFSPEILKQFRKIMAASEQITKHTYIQQCLQLSEYSMQLVQAGATLTSLMPKMQEYTKTHKMSAIVAPICSIISYAMSVASLSTVFMGWDQASALEKTESILSCIQCVANISTSAMKIKNILTLISDKADFSEKANAAIRLRFSGEDLDVLKSLGAANGQELDIALENSAKMYSLETTTSAEATSYVNNVTKFFRIAEIAVRILNVLMMGFMTVVSAIQISRDVKEHGYTTSACLEIISTCLMGISFVMEGISLALDIIGVTCSAIPVIGAVAALIGIVFSIASSSTQVTINPVAEFAKDVLAGFLGTLAIPAKEWIDNRNKVTVCKFRFALV